MYKNIICCDGGDFAKRLLKNHHALSKQHTVFVSLIISIQLILLYFWSVSSVSHGALSPLSKAWQQLISSQEVTRQQAGPSSCNGTLGHMIKNRPMSCMGLAGASVFKVHTCMTSWLIRASGCSHVWTASPADHGSAVYSASRLPTWKYIRNIHTFKNTAMWLGMMMYLGDHEL